MSLDNAELNFSLFFYLLAFKISYSAEKSMKCFLHVTSGPEIPSMETYSFVRPITYFQIIYCLYRLYTFCLKKAEYTSLQNYYYNSKGSLFLQFKPSASTVHQLS